MSANAERRGWERFKRQRKNFVTEQLTLKEEKRQYRRFKVDLPIKYSSCGTFFKDGKVANVSQGGLLLYLSEPMEIGQNLIVKMFSSIGSELNIIEPFAQVVWKDIISGEDRKDYRTGVKFAYIIPEDLQKLKNYLRGFSG